MLPGLIALLISILIIAIVAGVVIYCANLLPIDARLKQAARLVVILIAVLAVLMKVLPLLGAGM